MFQKNDIVKFTDDLKVERLGFVDAVDGDACEVIYRIAEEYVPGPELLPTRGQIKRVRFPTARLKASDPKFAFEMDETVSVSNGQTGSIVERKPIGDGVSSNEYAVMYKDATGRTALAWWNEAVLSKAK